MSNSNTFTSSLKNTTEYLLSLSDAELQKLIEESASDLEQDPVFVDFLMQNFIVNKNGETN